MPKLSGLNLSKHINVLLSLNEFDSIYGYPTPKFYRGFPGYDFSVKLFGKTAGTPMGPAAGPHTQLAHNILLSYLAGSRIVELKTIQILDQLEISRPCIDIRNIGFNIEWSQELSLDESFREYLHAWILLHILKEMKLLGETSMPFFYDFIFDISVGYDLKGIQSEQVQSWLNKIKNAEKYISEAMDKLPNKYQSLREIKIPAVISDSVTLSTFHGCPRDEIEKIATHLITQNGLNVVIKLNPTLLGFTFVNELLKNKLGYHQIQLDKSAFDNDLSLDQAVEMLFRLEQVAENHQRKIGVKFTNTLIVKNSENIFNEPVRYLSGSPLYVIAMHTMQQFREKAGWDLPVSFSGGIDRHNFADTLTCNMIPVTACTDILKKGGYSRFTRYLENLKIEMDKVKVNNLNDFIIKKSGTSNNKPAWKIGRVNTLNLINKIDNDPHYTWPVNNMISKHIKSDLKIFDCINCDICIPVCPNAANFSFSADPLTEHYSDYKYLNGSFSPVNEKTYVVKENQQIGNIAEFCNDCGNCETFCPESGAPYKIKPRFCISYETFRSTEILNGFHFSTKESVWVKLNGIESKLDYKRINKIYIWDTEQVIVKLNENNEILQTDNKIDIKNEFILNLESFIISKVILKNYIRYGHSFPNYIF